MVFELFFAGLAFFAAAPLWLMDHPPIQDLPQHLATIRVLVDHGDANLAFAEYFDVELGRIYRRRDPIIPAATPP